MPKVTSRKFVSPAFTGDKISYRENKNINDKEQENSVKSKEKMLPSCSLSDSQYDELFREVIKESSTITEDKKRGNVLYNDSEKEHNVVVPEPNAALSPDEEADATNDDKISDWTTVKTPDNPIDNSVLPPIKKKKRISRFTYLENKYKLKPTRLNFDDPDMGKPEKLPKTQKPTSLSTSSASKTENPKKSGKPKGLKPKTTKKTSPIKTKIMKSQNIIDDDRNGRYSEKVCTKPKFQNSQIADGRGAVSHKQKRLESPRNNLVTSSSQRNDSTTENHTFSQATPKSSQVLGSQASSISDSQVLSQRSRIIRLQKKRNVGLWVQCTKKDCSKWRYLASTCDPTEVPDDWQCFMNQDKNYARCSIPEKGPTPLEEEDLIHNIYTAGSLVWARLDGYPWWPAIVDDDPDVEQYYWINELCDIPTHYSVAFFDEKPVTRAWLTPNALTKYAKPEKKKDFDKTVIHGVNYSPRIKVAKSQADEALKYPIDERLRLFSFVARYKGNIGNKRKITHSQDGKHEKKDRKEDKKSELQKFHSEVDSPTDFRKSLEAVEEVNKVLSQLTSNSESEEGSSDEPQQTEAKISDFNLVKSSSKGKETIAKLKASGTTGPKCNTKSQEEAKRTKKEKAHITKSQAKPKCQEKAKEVSAKDHKTGKKKISNKQEKNKKVFATQGKGKKHSKCEKDEQKGEKTEGKKRKALKKQKKVANEQKKAISTSEVESDKESEENDNEKTYKTRIDEKSATDDGSKTPKKGCDGNVDVTETDNNGKSSEGSLDGEIDSDVETLIDEKEEIEEGKSNEGCESAGKESEGEEEESDIDFDKETVIEETPSAPLPLPASYAGRASASLPLPASYSGRASADLFNVRLDNEERLSVSSADFDVEE